MLFTIIYQIIKTANECGLTNLLYIAWYVMSELNMAQGKYIVTYGILNNSLIQLEKADNSNEYLMLLFKYNMYKVLRFQQKEEQAKICLAQADYISRKYGIKFEFDVAPEHFVPLVDPDAEENIVNNSQGFKTATIDDISPLEFEADTQESPVEAQAANNNTEGE